MRALLILALALTLAAAGCLVPSPSPPAAELPASARDFDAPRALEWVRLQVQGPAGEPLYRVPGTDGNGRVAAMIREALSASGWSATLEAFTGTLDGEPVPMHNVVGERGSGPLLILGAHYDTRPCADKDPDPTQRSMPVLGANDGASGVGALLEIARVLGNRSTNLTLRLVFFDGEDGGDGGRGCGQGTPWIQGSTYHAERMTDTDKARARGMILLDLVGDREAEFAREGHSSQGESRALQDRVWSAASALGHPQFRERAGPLITDDHVPFQQRGIPSVDIIHLDGGIDPFPETHHTTFDDLAHVSEQSLRAVGETALAVVLQLDEEAGAAG